MPSRSLCSLALVAVLLAGCATVPPVSGPSDPGTPTLPSAPPQASATTAPASDPPAQPATELPRGGRVLFPHYRLFGYSGYPGAKGQGRLGIGDLDARVREIEQRGQAWRGGRALLPVMELIAVTVQGSPGRDGKYRTRAPESVIKRWHDVAAKHKAMLLLNIQPGRADFLDEVKHLEKWLKYPDVGVALDPEWAVGKGQVPGRVFGHTTGGKLNEVAAYLSQLTVANNLPEKVMVFHQLHVTIVAKPKDLKRHPGVVYINSVDGIGSPGAKVATFRGVMRTRPSYVHAGFKLFYAEDVAAGKRLMTAKEVLRLTPQPEYILFE